MLHDRLFEEARALQGEIVALRRAIHAEPELGLHTPKTRDKVRESLADLPLEWNEGPSTTGLVATLKGGAGDGPCVLLRGDMDALPMPRKPGWTMPRPFPARCTPAAMIPTPRCWLARCACCAPGRIA